MDPRFMMIGEAPGETDLGTQMPFTGRAGNELAKFLDHIQVKREEIYITSVFRSRPYSIKQRMDKKTGEIFQRKYNRTPTKKEVLSQDAAEYVKSEKQYKVFTTYHPASIFYNRSLLETIYSDYEALKKYI